MAMQGTITHFTLSLGQQGHLDLGQVLVILWKAVGGRKDDGGTGRVVRLEARGIEPLDTLRFPAPTPLHALAPALHGFV